MNLRLTRNWPAVTAKPENITVFLCLPHALLVLKNRPKTYPAENNERPKNASLKHNNNRWK